MSGNCLICRVFQLASDTCHAMHALLWQGQLLFLKAPAMQIL